MSSGGAQGLTRQQVQHANLISVTALSWPVLSLLQFMHKDNVGMLRQA
jgi:hypothetical protein